MIVLATGCIDDHYECNVDSDCNVGVAGRCELDHHCTTYDPVCPLERRYTAHSGSASGACFEDTAVPLDPCASGQPPAPITNTCAIPVCARLPSCCTTGWSDACVQLAEVECGVTCDVRLALTAEQSVVPGAAGTVELFDLRLGTATPTYNRLDDAMNPRRGFLDWLAPARGKTEPRLAWLDADRANLVIDDAIAMPVGTDRLYDGLYAADFDRDGRDKVLLASYAIPDDTAIDVVDLETHRERELTTPGGMPLATPGDWDSDPFPDLVAANGGSQGYALYRNADDPATHARELDATWSSGATAATTGNVPLDAFAWADLDGDGIADLIELGAEVRVHFGNDDRQPDSPRVQIDCDPLAVNPNAACNGGTDVDVVGTPLVLETTTILVVSIDNGTHNLYRVDFAGKVPTIRATPLWRETCGSPSDCPPIRLVVARDVDGDHQLDLVAVDAAMNVYVLSAAGATLATVPAPSIAPVTAFRVVRASVSGAVK